MFTGICEQHAVVFVERAVRQRVCMGPGCNPVGTLEAPAPGLGLIAVGPERWCLECAEEHGVVEGSDSLPKGLPERMARSVVRNGELQQPSAAGSWSILSKSSAASSVERPRRSDSPTADLLLFSPTGMGATDETGDDLGDFSGDEEAEGVIGAMQLARTPYLLRPAAALRTNETIPPLADE